ncbi:ATP synthase subunit I [Paracoccus seriniphilus]|nr:ATP synthase subunit I [Paracoccus seriniphilus]WCR13017.1 hypothetical protein JHW44_08620 [Paracoccus seriniphilus]
MEMDEREMTHLPLTLAVCFSAGLLLGFAYFAALRMTADLIVGQGRPLLALGLTLGRLGAMVAALYLAVLFGGLALLAALGGVLSAKAVLVGKARRAGS